MMCIVPLLLSWARRADELHSREPVLAISIEQQIEFPPMPQVHCFPSHAAWLIARIQYNTPTLPHLDTVEILRIGSAVAVALL